MNIETEEQYTGALAEIEQLWDVKLGPAETKRFVELATAVEAYESIHYPIPEPSWIRRAFYRLSLWAGRHKRGLFTAYICFSFWGLGVVTGLALAFMLMVGR